ncbi:MAG: molybdenum cofactor guanylyltransferase [Bacteroidota bacterium]
MKALVLLGGKSTRMGREKHNLLVQGEPMYLRLYRLVTELSLPCYLSVSLEQVPQFEEKPKDFQLLVDQEKGIGPIGGILSAINEDDQSSWLVVACDLVQAQSETLKYLIDSDSIKHDIITYQQHSKPFFETTCTIYQPSSFSTIRRQVSLREYSLQSVLRSLRVKTITPKSDNELKNVNRPEDL